MTSPSRQSGLSGREVSRHAIQGGLVIAGATKEERRVVLVCDMSEMKDERRLRECHQSYEHG